MHLSRMKQSRTAMKQSKEKPNVLLNNNKVFCQRQGLFWTVRLLCALRDSFYSQNDHKILLLSKIPDRNLRLKACGQLRQLIGKKIPKSSLIILFSFSAWYIRIPMISLAERRLRNHKHTPRRWCYRLTAL